MLKKIIQLIVTTGCLLTVCTGFTFSPFVTWKEEVMLNDGRVIVVEQKKRADRGIAREAWLTISLPEFSAQPIVWHENLTPLIVNVDSGRLYVVGYPPTVVECRHYSDPRPFYVGFVWGGRTWNQIPFEEIPESIYTTNMLIEGFPPSGTDLLTLEKKNSREVNNATGMSPSFKRLNPKATCQV